MEKEQVFITLCYCHSIMAMSFVTFLQDVYERLQNATDKRVSDWLFVYSPVPTSTIVALYFIIVFHFGPQFMAER